MKAVASLLRLLSRRRLRLRAAQIAALAADSHATVYPEPLAFPGGQRVLVLAPHADDETFGMAGTMLRHLQAGDELHLLLFSDNSDSVPGAGGEEAAALRAAEFAAAMRALGLADGRRITAAGLPPAAFGSAAAPPQLRAALIGIQPRVLYLPSLFDNHAHHRRVAQWAAQELSASRPDTMQVRGYEVWTPLPATAIVDISAHIDTKRTAMQCYRSQNLMIDYIHHMLGLNAYRAITLEGARYAEAFHACGTASFLRLAATTLAS